MTASTSNSASADPLAVLVHGLDQAAVLLGKVSADDLDRPTPCPDWTVSDLVDHLVAAPPRLARMVRGEAVDWAAATPHVEDRWDSAFRGSAVELVTALEARGADSPGPGPKWQCAEVAVHTWDLATALGGRPARSTRPSPRLVWPSCRPT